MKKTKFQIFKLKNLNVLWDSSTEGGVFGLEMATNIQLSQHYCLLIDQSPKLASNDK